VERQRDFPQANARARRLRRQLTPAEKRLWSHLQKIEGRHFRKQSPIGPYTFDFVEMGAQLIIEVDGGIHAIASVAARDTAKQAWAVAQGFTVLRIPNAYVFGTGEPAVEMVMKALREADQQRAR